jgi:sugar transferase (PEP-CTERM/EpsH1 system associated)
LISSERHKDSILFLVSRFPYPLEKGDKLRAYYQLIELSKKYNVTLVSLSDEKLTPDTISAVKKWCMQVHIIQLTRLSKTWYSIGAFFTDKPIQSGYFYSRRAQRKITMLVNSGGFSHIYCQLIRTSRYVSDFHHISKTLDYMDALSVGIKRRINKQPFYLRWLFRMEAKRLALYEQKMFDFFENKTIISDQDKTLIAHPEHNQIATIPNGVGSIFLEDMERTETYDLVFVGNMSYPPNIDAVHFIDKNILSEKPHLTLLVAGASPHSSITKLDAKPNITVSGWIDDIRTAYLSGKIFIAPMKIGTGQQNKLLEAMALGTPCITTSLCNNAIKATNGEEIIVAEEPVEMRNRIDILLASEQIRKDMSVKARQFVKDIYTWDKTTSKLVDLIDESINKTNS